MKFLENVGMIFNAIFIHINQLATNATFWVYENIKTTPYVYWEDQSTKRVTYPSGKQASKLRIRRFLEQRDTSSK